MSKVFLTSKQCYELAAKCLVKMREALPKDSTFTVYGVPRGGIPVTYMMTAIEPLCKITDDPRMAHFIVDDIVDSGATRDSYKALYSKTNFHALVDKTDPANVFDAWIVFPWEAKEDGQDEGIEDNIRRMLQRLDPDPEREGIQETPKRVAKAWDEWTSGYHLDAKTILKEFKDGAEGCNEMVIVKDLPFYSKCEHHMADIFGTATIAYIPNGKVVGLSKLSRILDMYAKRLQVQERLTNQIADCLTEHLNPEGVGVIIKARHMCMESRGVCKQGHHTITSALRGVLKSEPDARAEFIALSN